MASKKDTILSALQKANLILKNGNIKNVNFSSQLLLSHILKIKKCDLFLYHNKKIAKKDWKSFFSLINRRKKHEPIEYILKEIDFYSCKISVDKNVLIPRQETEILVDLVAKELEKQDLKNKVLIDVCTGSGAIAIALKKKFKDLMVFASDISDKALMVAKKNAKKNNVKIIFKKGDLLVPFKKIKADFLVSNPPYVSKKEFEKLDKDILNYEPAIALKAKEEGFEFYKKIEKQLFNITNNKIKLFFEIGCKQKEGLLNIFSNKKYIKKMVLRDFSKKDRFFFVEIE